MVDRKYQRGELSQPIKRFIKRKEKELNRTCRTIWTYTNHKNETFMFGSFCRNHDKVFVTLAYLDPRIHTFLPSH